MAIHQALLEQLVRPLQLTSEFRIEPLNAGAVNLVFKLIDGDKCYVVKYTGEDSFSGINRVHQWALQEQLAKRELAPKPIWISDNGRLWVESWYPPQVNRDNSPVDVLAKALSVIHSQPITGRPLDLTARWEHYRQFAKLDANNSLVRKSYALHQVIDKLASDSQDICLCHNDLSLGHVLSTEPFVIVDWEYASMGNRYFDLAACVKINCLDEKTTEQLCLLYSKHLGIELAAVQKGVKQHIPIVDITYDLWTMALQEHQHAMGLTSI